MSWKVMIEPIKQVVGSTNEKGVVVYLTRVEEITLEDGTILTVFDEKFETCRVAFARRNSKNPKQEFGETFEQELEKAREAGEAIEKAFAAATAAATKNKGVLT